jgi:hypothetical protein
MLNLLLQPQININLSADHAKPGETLNLTVSSDPNSSVHLLGVDQSVLLMKKGNDIEKSSVSSDFENYNGTDYHNTFYGENTYRHIYQDFNSSNVVMITNATEEHGKSVTNL